MHVLDAPSVTPSPRSAAHPLLQTYWIAPVLLAALFTCGFAYLVSDYQPSPDAREYLTLGIHLAESGSLRLQTGEVAKRMPLYPALLAAVRRWQGPEAWENAALAIQTILCAASVVLIGVIARRLADPLAGLVAGLIAALYAPYRYLQMSFLTESLAIFLLLSAVCVYLAACGMKSSRTADAVRAGASLLLGLCILTRADAAVFVLPFMFDAALRGGAFRRRACRIAVVILPAVLCAAGWGLRNSSVLGTFTLSTAGGLNFHLGHNVEYAQCPDMQDADYGAFDRLRAAGLSEAEADRRLYDQGLAFIRANSGETISNVLRKVVVWLTPHVTDSAPSTVLIMLLVLAFHGRSMVRVNPSSDAARWFFRSATIGAIAIGAFWALVLSRTDRPWTSPREVIPLGLAALVLYGSRLRLQGLLIGLVAAQLLVAVAYVPLERLRWTIDGLLIVAIGAAVSRLCSRSTAAPV